MLGVFDDADQVVEGRQQVLIVCRDVRIAEHLLAVVGDGVETDDLWIIIVLHLVQVLPIRECHAHYIEIDQIITFLISNVERRI